MRIIVYTIYSQNGTVLSNGRTGHYHQYSEYCKCLMESENNQ